MPSVNPKELSSVPLPAPAPVPFSFEPPAIADVTVPSLGALTQATAPPTAPSPAVTMPMKRRREVISPESPATAATADAAAAAVGGAGTSRRRTRSWRGNPDQHSASSQQAGEAMDIEEEGPQRKRIARR
ncbi:hypothetical protein ONZ51_g10833 [Trametes cubensis]|uniref:Uncharacterized protein n=1 Tax=Trametes cubensis TaxID=1111947 RepID=A0AAD7TJ98_9APHY|nr:hypothetical protein ONZ51_g10833 [Trametes cubensis]